MKTHLHTSVTVGIPAYNEGKNIAQLLNDISQQQANHFTIDKIIIVSDGSTDNTVSLAQQIKDKRITIINRKERKGLAFSMNEIITNTHSDVLVLFNADISIPDVLTIEKMITPVQKGSDLVSIRITPKSTHASYLQQILTTSMRYKNSLFDALHNGDTVYTCHGPARAFSKKLYTHLRFSFSVGEDMYSYLYAKKHGYTYTYVPTAYAYYTLPTALGDHANQSIRFFKSKQLMYTTFGKQFVDAALHIPFTSNLKALLNVFYASPITMICYIALSLGMMLKAKFAHLQLTTWEPAKSSKIL